LTHLGREGYRTIIKHCMRMTLKLAEGIEEIEGVSLATHPTMNMIGIKSEELNVDLLAQELRKRGWAIALFPGYIRIVVMPHIKSSHIQSFLEGLKDTVKKLRGRRSL